ncbi:TnpV protein [Ruminococcaceae bacterium OttesenSCG-928-L11]|nr:TnpV protein [Ruminococcaceae bacterium OttesenSCG-928-L11]
MNEITYSKNGDYLVPDIAIPETAALGKYGMMRKNYLRQHRPTLYTNFTLAGTLFPHCLEIEMAATERLELMMPKLMAKNPPPNKATDPMGWTAHMNSLKAGAEEIILSELIYS